MFIRTKTHERMLEELKASHARLVDMMAEQVDFLRLQLGFARTQAADNVSDSPPVIPGEPMHVTEEEEDVRAQFERGEINADQLEQILAAHQLANTRVDIAE